MNARLAAEKAAFFVDKVAACSVRARMPEVIWLSHRTTSANFFCQGVVPYGHHVLIGKCGKRSDFAASIDYKGSQQESRRWVSELWIDPQPRGVVTHMHDRLRRITCFARFPFRRLFL